MSIDRLYRSKIIGVGGHLPDKVVTNDDLSKMMDTSDEWIKTRTGIHQRHTVGKNCLGPADLAVEAAKKAFHLSDITKEDIDFVVNSFRNKALITNSTLEISDALVLSVSTDEGLFDPYGLCDIRAEISYRYHLA